MADLTQIIERQGWEEFCHCSVTQALNLDLKEKKKRIYCQIWFWLQLDPAVVNFSYCWGEILGEGYLFHSLEQRSGISESFWVCVSFVKLGRENFESLTEKGGLSLEVSRIQADGWRKWMLWRWISLNVEQYWQSMIISGAGLWACQGSLWDPFLLFEYKHLYNRVMQGTLVCVCVFQFAGNCLLAVLILLTK